MDCTDIMIGAARGDRFRVFDYYTRDRATPRRDTFYGGKDDITAAVGKEEGGFTYIKFRKPLMSGTKDRFHGFINRIICNQCIDRCIQLVISVQT